MSACSTEILLEGQLSSFTYLEPLMTEETGRRINSRWAPSRITVELLRITARVSGREHFLTIRTLPVPFFAAIQATKNPLFESQSYLPQVV